MPFAKASRNSGTSELEGEQPAQPPDASRAATGWGPALPSAWGAHPIPSPVPHLQLPRPTLPSSMSHWSMVRGPCGVASSQRPAGQVLCPPPSVPAPHRAGSTRSGPSKAHACGSH